MHLLGAAEVLNTLSGAETLLVHELVNVLYVLYGEERVPLLEEDPSVALVL